MYHQRADALVLTFGQNSVPAFHPASGIRHRVQTNPRPAREARFYNRLRQSRDEVLKNLRSEGQNPTFLHVAEAI
jgi:hypothetical protein